jgi:hypothetical protein
VLAAYLVGLLGCAQSDQRSYRVDRPVAGDQVTPEVLLAGDWKGGQKGYLGVRFRVQGQHGPALLRQVEVPGDVLPRMAVTFLRGEEELLRTEPTLQREC